MRAALAAGAMREALSNGFWCDEAGVKVEETRFKAEWTASPEKMAPSPEQTPIKAGMKRVRFNLEEEQMGPKFEEVSPKAKAKAKLKLKC